MAEHDHVRLDPTIRHDIDRFADAVSSLTDGDCTRLLAFWRGIDPDRLRATHARARGAATRTGRSRIIRELQDVLVAWSGGGPIGRTGRSDRWFDPSSDPLDGQGIRADALPALADAALGIALRDTLDESDVEVLCGPWLDAMGEDGSVSGGGLSYD
jgi:hypothetical protein